jgi:hypothetical protein
MHPSRTAEVASVHTRMLPLRLTRR